MIEGLLEQVGLVQTGICFQEAVQLEFAFPVEVLPIGQQVVTLPLDEPAFIPVDPLVLRPPDFVDCGIQVLGHVEVVVGDLAVGAVGLEGLLERPPHVHHSQLDLLASLDSKGLVEQVHALDGSILTAKPDRTAAFQIVHDDPVLVPLADRNLVFADHPRRLHRVVGKLPLHVLDVQGFDRVPVQEELVGHRLDRCLAAAPANALGKAFAVVSGLGQPSQRLGLHPPAPRTLDPADLDVQPDPPTTAVDVSNEAMAAIIDRGAGPTAGIADRLFFPDGPWLRFGRSRHKDVDALGPMVETQGTCRRP